MVVADPPRDAVRVSSPALGGSLTGVTVMVTVAVLEMAAAGSVMV